MPGNGTSSFFSRAPGWMYFGGRDVETSDYRGDCALRLHSRATPLSLGLSPEGTVSVSEDTASAVIGRPLTLMSVAGVNRRATACISARLLWIRGYIRVVMATGHTSPTLLRGRVRDISAAVRVRVPAEWIPVVWVPAVVDALKVTAGAAEFYSLWRRRSTRGAATLYGGYRC